MKKYLLTLALSIFWFISFSNADDILVAKWSLGYEPSQIYFLDWWSLSTSFVDVSNVNCNLRKTCSIIFTQWDKVSKLEFNQSTSELYLSEWDWVVFDEWYVELSCWSVCFNYLTLSSSIISLSSWWDSWSWTWDSLLPWWESDLSWIITWLNSTIIEFIPYLVYLGLWIITVIIWFVAIRWLVNRTQAKIRWTFSSWRRRK